MCKCNKQCCIKNKKKNKKIFHGNCVTSPEDVCVGGKLHIRNFFFLHLQQRALKTVLRKHVLIG